MLWIQAIVEEVGWRGYLLPRLMQRAGRGRGFSCTDFWGAVLLAGVLVVGDSNDLWRAASFIVTCGLLGILLDWLRLASGSIAASATCNATLTLAAGLPLVLHGMTPMLSAIFEPAGWLPMMLVIVWIASRPSLARPPWSRRSVRSRVTSIDLRRARLVCGRARSPRTSSTAPPAPEGEPSRRHPPAGLQERDEQRRAGWLERAWRLRWWLACVVLLALALAAIALLVAC